MQKALKSIDIFGEKVGVNYKGSQTHNTTCGSLTTLITTACILTFTVQTLLEMTTYENQKESTRRILVNTEDIGQVNFKEYDFNLLLWQTAYFKGSEDGVDNYKMPERIGKWVVYTKESNGALQIFNARGLDMVSR